MSSSRDVTATEARTKTPDPVVRRRKEVVDEGSSHDDRQRVPRRVRLDQLVVRGPDGVIPSCRVPDGSELVNNAIARVPVPSRGSFLGLPD